MIYVSIDIETTGLDREKDQVLEIAAIIENSNNILPYEELPKFTAIIDQNRISGSPYAIKMNQRIIDILANKPKLLTQARQDYFKQHNIISEYQVGDKLAEFIDFHYTKLGVPLTIGRPLKIIPAGKNFDSFDRIFLNRLPNFYDHITFHHRSINVGEYFIDFESDTIPPSLDQCLERAGFTDNKVTHEALSDAWDVIKVLRTQYGRKWLPVAS